MKIKSINLYSTLVCAAVFAITLALRVYAISDRPFHNDEGVNYFFVKDVLDNGYYSYSHKNYHGPSYFYVISFFSYLFGISDLTIRLSSIFPALLLCAFFLFEFKYLPCRYRMVTALFLAVSTTFLYYSRYAIHESLLVLSCILGLHYAFSWAVFRRERTLIYLFLTTALAISTKETFIIHFAALTFSIVLIFPIRDLYSLLVKSYVPISWGVFFGLLVILCLYSGFFQSSQGIREFFLGVPQWVGRGHSDVGHHKPYWYYYKILRTTEPVTLLCLIPLVVFISRSLILFGREFLSLVKIPKFWKSASMLNLLEVGSRVSSSLTEKASFAFSLYALASFLAYSYVPYKTPWLIINISVPAIIGFSLFLPTLIKSRWLLNSTYVFLFFYSFYFSLKFNYLPETLGSLNPVINSVGVVGDKNPLAYVHTSPGSVELADKIKKYIDIHPNTRILIGVSSYWPLPYYFREFDSQLMYAQGSDPKTYFKDYQIIIANHEMIAEEPGWRREHLRLSDNQESQVYFKE